MAGQWQKKNKIKVAKTPEIVAKVYNNYLDLHNLECIL